MSDERAEDRTTVAVHGATGYAARELLTILLRHPHARVTALTTRRDDAPHVAAVHPALHGRLDLRCENLSPKELAGRAEVVFCCTPHGASMAVVPELLDAGAKVIDLSADYRLNDAAVYQQWYGLEHTDPGRLADKAYGLPELNRSLLAYRGFVANPGCYPTAVQLGFLPLLEAGLVRADALVADAKSGVTGAGRGAAVANLLAEAADSFRAYGVAGHRHLPEIEQGLAAAGGGPVSLTFVPHLLPMIRGIEATLYAPLVDPSDPAADEAALQALFEARYADEPFVDVMPAGTPPETRSVRGSNLLRLSVHRPQGRATVVVSAVEDNLVKGAAGQAVQNMNLMLGLGETAGLELVPLSP